MKLSRAATYALYGTSYLASQPRGRMVPLSEIHERYGVPEKHLAKIFQGLVRARLLVSARGVGGGFALAKPADEISPLDVVEAVDGPVDESGCLLLRQSCARQSVCRLNLLWRDAQRQMLAVLRQATLLDVVEGPQPLVRLRSKGGGSRLASRV